MLTKAVLISALVAVASAFSTSAEPNNNCERIGSLINCLKADYDGLECSWCASGAVPDRCVSTEDAEKLPYPAFHCANTKTEKCGNNTDKNNCSYEVGCYWCTGRKNPGECLNYADFKSAGSAVSCQGPYNMD